MSHVLCRDKEENLVVMPICAFDAACAEGVLLTRETEPIYEGDIEDCLRAQIAIEKKE